MLMVIYIYTQWRGVIFDANARYAENRNYDEKKISFRENFSTQDVPFPAGCGLRKLGRI